MPGRTLKSADLLRCTYADFYFAAMKHRATSIALYALASLLLTGCALMRSPHDPAKDQQYVSVINSLSWTNPMTGKRDGVRTSWPVTALAGHAEVFPLAQLRQCPEPQAEAQDSQAGCAWGVMAAERKIGGFSYQPGGVALDLALAVDIDRRQEMRGPDLKKMAMSIPADMPALKYRKKFQQKMTLPYGVVQQIQLGHGLRFDICARRLDAAGRALDPCEIPYI